MCRASIVVLALTCSGAMDGIADGSALRRSTCVRDDAEGCDVLVPPLPVASGVRDPVFAIVVGLVEANARGCLSGADLARELAAARRKTRLPYQTVRELRRAHAEDGITSRVSMRLAGALVTPVPYRLLFYRPGRIRVDARLELIEWEMGDLAAGAPAAAGRPSAPAPTAAHVFAVDAGRIEVDVDGWLDALAGPRLDDTELTGLAVFRQYGRWWGVGYGHNGRGEPRVGLFDFAADEVVLPVPGPMRPWVRRLREALEARATARGAARRRDGLTSSRHLLSSAPRSPGRAGP